MQVRDHIIELQNRFGEISLTPQPTPDGIPTLWVPNAHVRDVLRYFKMEVESPYRTLYDLCAIDERVRDNRQNQPESDFTVVYHLLSYGRNADVRIKVALTGDRPSIQSVVDIWPSANWYEREVWDMFGITVEGHPNLRRILMPPTWIGHPLRKDHPARATEIGPF
jgi:NADH-quinone oxidoreductase subunit C/D